MPRLRTTLRVRADVGVQHLLVLSIARRITGEQRVTLSLSAMPGEEGFRDLEGFCRTQRSDLIIVSSFVFLIAECRFREGEAPAEP